ncbi:MAG: Blue-light-activated protein [Fibrobacteres bacterium]|nr:Blue-light-activated protein [Fibrobacterota bacterium]
MENPKAAPAAPILILHREDGRIKDWKDSLNGAGVEVATASSLEAALNQLDLRPHAAILMEVREPRTDGFANARLIRRIAGSERTPLLFLCAPDLGPKDFDIPEACGLGPVDYLFCPFTTEILASKVGIYADLYHKARELASLSSEAERRAFDREKALQDSEDRFRLITDNVEDYAIVMMDPEGNYTTWNYGAQRLLGYSEEEMIGTHSFRIFTPEDLVSGAAAREMAHARDFGQAIDERWHVRRDGTRFWGSGMMTSMRDKDGRLRGYVKIMRDFTERRAAQEAQTKSEELFRKLVEDVRDYAIYMIDPDGKVSSWNRGAERIKGYQAEEILGKNYSAFYTPEDLENGKPEYERNEAAEKGRFEDKGWRVRKDGQWFWADEVISAIRDKEGNLLGFTKVTRDITERKKADEAKQRQFRFLEAMNEISKVLEVNLDLEAILQSAMEKIRALFKCDCAYMAQPGFPDTGHVSLPFISSDPVYPGPENGSILPMNEFNRMAYSEILATMEPVSFGEHRPAPGFEEYRERFCVRSMMLIALRPRVGSIWVLGVNQCSGPRDWSEEDRALFKEVAYRISMTLNNLLFHRNLRESEERLRRSRQQLETILEGITDAIIVHDPSGRVEYLNRAAASLIGYPSPQALMEASSGEDAEAWRHDIRIYDEDGNAIPAGKTPRELAGRGLVVPPMLLRYRNGAESAERQVINRAMPIKDAEGKVQYIIGISQDVTEIRKAEAELRQSQKMEAIGRLAGGIAHDFNNLLTAINGYSEVGLGMAAAGDPLKPILEEILEAGRRAASLTNQLLAHSRKQMLKPKILNLNETIGTMHAMMKRIIGEDIELVIDLDGNGSVVKADPGQVEQVILNLAVNARDAMPKGGKVTIKTREADVSEGEIGFGEEIRPGRYFLLSVSDTGHGMSKAVQDHLFEPFFTTKPIAKGTGLGLSTVYGIVKQSGGHISVESEPGHGATFRIYFPLVSQEANHHLQEHPSRRQEMPLTADAGQTVLLVEDEDVVRKLANSILAKLGYQVLEAGSGEKAMEVAESHDGPIHLLLTDVVMNGMGGQELAHHVCAIRPETAILYMSGYTDDAIVRHGVLEATSNFIQKPFSPKDLSVKVREVLSQRNREAGALEFAPGTGKG